MKPIASLTFLLACLGFTSADNSTLLWANAGGGWRGLFSSMGYVHLFHKIGLISSNDTQFDILAANDGGVWFFQQYLYSSKFYEKMMALEDVDDLESFAADYMSHLADGLPSPNATFDPRCSRIKQAAHQSDAFEGLLDICMFGAAFDYDWTKYTNYMFASTADFLGDDEFINRMAVAANRVPAFQNTDYHVQLALSPGFISRENGKPTASYILSPGGDHDRTAYTVPIPLQYVVRKSGRSFYSIGLPEEALPLKAHKETKKPGSSYFLGDWVAGGLYAAFNLTDKYHTLVNLTDEFVQESATLDKIFGIPVNENDSSKGPTMLQLMSATSASVAAYSASVPGMQSQRLTVSQVTAQNNPNITLFIDAALETLKEIDQSIYEGPLFADFSICSNSPAGTCGLGDAHLVDGSFVDDTALAQTIGMHQKKQRLSVGTKNKLKIVLTHHKWAGRTNVRVLELFSTDFNKDVKPGDFVWPPGLSTQFIAEETPRFSKQVFSNEYSEETLAAATKSLAPQTNTSGLTYALLADLTTVDNPVFGVEGGWEVDILLLQANTPLVNSYRTVDGVKSAVSGFAALAKDVASNDKLKKVLQEFTGTGSGESRGSSPSRMIPSLLACSMVMLFMVIV